MRKISFRAWDKDLKKMYSKWTVIPEDDRSHILMQYTGLKDKNGKEIYEKDLIEYEGKIYTVGFKDGSFLLLEEDIEVDGDSVSGSFYRGQFMAKLEDEMLKIGNIYENKELLK